MPELDRRDFLKIVGLGAGAAAAAGCSDPVEKLVPYVIQPEEITPGIPVVYASTCMECPVRCGIHVKTREGRPIKIEGNPDHPVNAGKLCARGQTGHARTYHPDRYDGPLARGTDGTLQPISWEDARAKVTGKLQQSAGRTWILTGDTGPSLTGLIEGFVSATGAAGRVTYEALGEDTLRMAAMAVFGVDGQPLFDVSKADLIVDFGSDFLDTGLTPTEMGRQWAQARHVSGENGGARLVSLAPRLTLTASNADEWIPCKPGTEGLVALAIADEIFRAKGSKLGGDTAALARALRATDAGKAASEAEIDRSVLAKLAKRLLAAKTPVALPPGAASASDKASGAVAAVLILNAVIGAVGSTPDARLKIASAPATSATGLAPILGLIDAMNAGKVDCLIIHDTNPIYSLPKSAGLAEALAKVDLVVSTASALDETSQAAGLILPDHTPMESWGDAEPRPGVRSVVQPTIRPLKDTQAFGDTLLALARSLGHDLGQASFKDLVAANWQGGAGWRMARATGGSFAPAAPVNVTIASSVASLDYGAPSFSGSGDMTLVAFPHSFLYDGRGANLPWLQETPHPVTKLYWNSWAELSFATAERLGVSFGDVVEIATADGSIEVSVFPRGGIRDDVVAVPTGQGHELGHYASMAGDGQPGTPRGANVIDLLPAKADGQGARVWLGATATVKKTGKFRRLALSQWTDNQRNRGLQPLVPLSEIGGGEHAAAKGATAGGLAAATRETDKGLVAARSPKIATGVGLAAAGATGSGSSDAMEKIGADFESGGSGEHLEGPPFEYEPKFDADPDSPYRWGMMIDNDLCTGCSACIVACYTENNVSIVGEENCIKHREMTWIRIERYIGDGDRQGGYSRRPFPNREKLGNTDVRTAPMLCQQCGAAPCESVCPVIATYHSKEGLNGMIYNRCVGTRYCANNCSYKVRRFNYFDYGNKNWPGMLALGLNPDVTVRQQGVMEKCTFCVQRIHAARQPAKDEGRPIRDGEVVTACQQTCPTSAITFGNYRDEQSELVKKSTAGEEQGRAYHSLQILNLRPSITYLAQVKREENEGAH